MKKLLCTILLLGLVISCLPAAVAQSALAYTYDNSVLISYQTHVSNQKTAQEFASLFSADA